MIELGLWSIVTITFLGSFGHCIGMCGGIVIAYSGSKMGEDWNKTRQALAHLLYGLGRVSTYALIGAGLGWLGSMIAFNAATNAALYLVAGVAMVLAGLALLGKLRFLTAIEHSLSSTAWYRQSFGQLIKSQSLASFYGLGLLNGLLPCGFVYFFAITAAATASATQGAIVMAVFGLATVPALFLLGSFVGLLKQTRLRTWLMRLAALLVIAYGLNTLYTGYYFATDPQASLQHCH